MSQDLGSLFISALTPCIIPFSKSSCYGVIKPWIVLATNSKPFQGGMLINYCHKSGLKKKKVPCYIIIRHFTHEVWITVIDVT